MSPVRVHCLTDVVLEHGGSYQKSVVSGSQMPASKNAELQAIKGETWKCFIQEPSGASADQLNQVLQ